MLLLQIPETLARKGGTASGIGSFWHKGQVITLAINNSECKL